MVYRLCWWYPQNERQRNYTAAATCRFVYFFSSGEVGYESKIWHFVIYLRLPNCIPPKRKSQLMINDIHSTDGWSEKHKNSFNLLLTTHFCALFSESFYVCTHNYNKFPSFVIIIFFTKRALLPLISLLSSLSFCAAVWYLAERANLKFSFEFERKRPK